MLRLTAKTVKAIDGYKILIEFDSGEKKVFNVSPYTKGNWYGELSDKTYFGSVFTNGYTVEWPHGQDLCPDEIYYNSQSI